MEFGCGLGTTSDYLARFTKGGSDVICIEPEVMLAEVFATGRPQPAPRQLAMNIFDSHSTPCVRDLVNTPSFKNDLVISLEVAEHIDEASLPYMASFLANVTGKFLVFAASRPGQEGTGHISLRTRKKWIETFEALGMVYEEEISQALLRAGNHTRKYDLGVNTIVMRPKSFTDFNKAAIIAPTLDIAGDDRFFPHGPYERKDAVDGR
jgi:hypothetical protein